MPNKNSNPISCIHCQKCLTSKGIFTHYLRSHGTESEKEKMSRSNITVKEDRHKTNKEKCLKRKQRYFLNPKTCATCEVILTYERRWNKFCSHSCAAIFNNKNHAPGRKFGPDRSKPKSINKPRVKKLPPIKQVKIRKVKKIKWNQHIGGDYCKLYYCNCTHCGLQFFSKKIQKYCNEHIELYVSARNRFQFTFNVYEYSDLFDISLLKKYGWYSPGNRGPKNNEGVSRDHRISVRDAVKNNYDPYYITHPLNCELMQHKFNKKKYTSSSLSYDVLVNLVNEYEMARSSGTDPHPLVEQTDSLAGCV
jgi:hypothetical protein